MIYETSSQTAIRPPSQRVLLNLYHAAAAIVQGKTVAAAGQGSSPPGRYRPLSRCRWRGPHRFYYRWPRRRLSIDQRRGHRCNRRGGSPAIAADWRDLVIINGPVQARTAAHIICAKTSAIWRFLAFGIIFSQPLAKAENFY